MTNSFMLKQRFPLPDSRASDFNWNRGGCRGNAWDICPFQPIDIDH